MRNLFGGIAVAFESRNYRLFWYGQTCNNLGVWIQRAGVQWLAWELTHSFTWLGIIGAATMLPTLIFGPIAGTAADRYGHRRQLQVAASLAALNGFVMGGVTLMGAMTAEILLVMTLFHGVFRSFTVPARNALIHSLVDRKHLSAAIGLNAATYQGSIFVGAAIGGGIVVIAGAGASFIVYALTVVIAVIMIGVLDIPAIDRKLKERGSFISELGDGFVYAYRHRGIRIVLVFSLLLALFVQPYQEMLSGIAADVFAGGPGTYTLLFSASGLGAMIGGLWIARRGRTEGLTRILLINTAAALIGLVIFALSPALWLSAASSVIVGSGLVVATAAALSLIQTAVDADIRARVLSMASVIAVGAPALSAIAIGWLASRFGVQWPLAGVAVIGIVIGILTVSELHRHGPALEADGSTNSN